MQKIAAVLFFILTLVFHFSGSSVLFHLQRQRIRKEVKTRIKRKIPESELEILQFSRSGGDPGELHWVREDEFRYRGKMYDVVRREISNDGSLLLYCINDRQEALLFTHLEALIQKQWNQGSGQERHQQMLSALSTFYLPPGTVDSPAFSLATSGHNGLYLFSLKTWAQPPALPPPRPQIRFSSGTI